MQWRSVGSWQHGALHHMRQACALGQAAQLGTALVAHDASSQPTYYEVARTHVDEIRQGGNAPRGARCRDADWAKEHRRWLGSMGG